MKSNERRELREGEAATWLFGHQESLSGSKEPQLLIQRWGSLKRSCALQLAIQNTVVCLLCKSTDMELLKLQWEDAIYKCAVQTKWLIALPCSKAKRSKLKVPPAISFETSHTPPAAVSLWSNWNRSNTQTVVLNIQLKKKNQFSSATRICFIHPRSNCQ